MMRGNYVLVLVALVLVAAVTSLLPAQDTPRPFGGVAQEWEYRVLLLTDLTGRGQDAAKEVSAVESKFNELGRDGWEFSQIHLMAAVFKRPKK